MDLVDVVPALYSSPKLINPLLAAERRGHFPDVGRLSMLDSGQSRAPHNRGFNPLAGTYVEREENGGSTFPWTQQ
jgi:hypothetical protein